MPFERDLGYLWKFFDNLEAHADSQGIEGLKQFTLEERERWQAAVPWLAGNGETPADEPTDTPPPEKPSPKRLAYHPAPPRLHPILPKPQPKKGPTGLTVGSLIEYR